MGVTDSILPQVRLEWQYGLGQQVKIILCSSPFLQSGVSAAAR